MINKNKIRIIPTILYNNITTIKGKKFKSWRSVGSLLQTTRLYSLREVDEIIFLDIAATKNYSINFKLIDEIFDECFMPVIAGGGVKTIDDIKKILKSGADRVSINTSAFENNKFLKDAIKIFGKQCIVVSVDYKKIDGELIVFTHSGEVNTKTKLYDYLNNLEKINAGEILLTSIDHDGMMNGYDFDTIKKIDKMFKLKFIISGGMSTGKDIKLISNNTQVEAFSMSSIFHFTEQTPLSVKKYLKRNKVNVRL